MRAIVLLALTLASAPSLAEIYRWVDPASGKTMVSDTPPPGSARNVTRARTPDAAGEPLSFAVKKAMENFPVTLYTTAECVAECKQARDLLNARGVPFTEKMVQKPEETEELKQLVGDLFVPSLKVGQQTARGFQAAAYNNLLNLAGYPTSAPAGSKPAAGLPK